MLVIGRFALPRLFAQAARTKSPELFLAASLLVVIGASLATAAVGLSPIVGALIAGLLIAETEYHAEVEGIIEPFKGLALGVFLITVGMSIDLATIWANLGTIALAVVGVLALKALVTGVLLRLMGARRGTATETGHPDGEPVGNHADRARRRDRRAADRSRETAQFWQIVTAIGLTVTPLLALARPASWRGGSSRSPQLRRRRSAARPRAIIVGCGPRRAAGGATCSTVHGKPYVAIDTDADLIERARRDGLPRDVRQRRARRHARPAGHRPRPGGDPDDGRAGAGAAPHRASCARPIPTCRSSPARATSTTPPRSTAPAPAPRCPRRSKARCSCREAVLVDLGVAMGPVIASIHEKRDEFREQIMREGELDAQAQAAHRAARTVDRGDSEPLRRSAR